MLTFDPYEVRKVGFSFSKTWLKLVNLLFISYEAVVSYKNWLIVFVGKPKSYMCI